MLMSDTFQAMRAAADKGYTWQLYPSEMLKILAELDRRDARIAELEAVLAAKETPGA
jgi:hypothetical protein